MLHADQSAPGDRVIGAAAIGEGADGSPSLIGCRCNSCGNETIPPLVVCPACGSEEVEPAIQPSRGTLYSYTVLHVGAAKWRRPLRIGYVDLTNGVRVFTQLDGDDIAIGDTVEFGTAAIGRDADGELTGYVFRKRGEAR